ncbi:hypothetical protein GN156_05715 [bacterium LRH843]|nr:hypothetical protein [bacterium LRH843]
MGRLHELWNERRGNVHRIVNDVNKFVDDVDKTGVRMKLMGDMHNF